VFLFGTNLKMYQTPAQTAAFVLALRERLLQLPYRDELILWVAPPYTSIQAAAKAARGASIWVGAQNMRIGPMKAPSLVRFHLTCSKPAAPSL